MASANIYAQAQIQFQSAYHGKVESIIQNTYPAYIDHNEIKGNKNAISGRSGFAYIFDKKGIKQNQVFNDGETQFPVDFKYKYDGKRIVAQEYYINKPSTHLWKTAYFKYDKKNIIEITSISAKGDTMERTRFRYDKKLLVDENYCNYKDTTEQYLSEYIYTDGLNKPSKIKYYVLTKGKKRLGSVSTSGYNKHMDEKASETYSADGTLIAITTYKYVYDDQGNWTRRETYVGGEIQDLTEAKYKYY